MGGGERDASSIFSPVLELIEERLKGQLPEHCSEDQLEKVISTAFDTVGNDNEVTEVVRGLLGKGEKNREMSIAAREEGNKQFQAGKLKESLACYNTAVLTAPWPSDEAVMALGNRAAVLGKMKKHKRVVDDLTFALDSGYPRHLHYKAWQRLAVAYEGLGLSMKAKEAYEKLLGVLDYSDIPTDRVGKMRKDASMALKTLIVEEEERDKDEVLKLLSRNSSFPTLSEKVEMRESVGQGRFLVARQTIDPGEVVSREEALAASLDPIHRAEQCTHCLRHALAPLPCPSCALAAFCCRECQDAGLVGHAFTCRLMSNPNLSTVTGRSDEDTTRLLLTLRIVTARPISFHLEYFNSWSSSTPSPPKSEPFTQVLHLVKHLPHLLLSPHIASVFLLLHLLRAVSYIPSDTPIEQERQLCLLITHIHAAIKPNIHASFQAGVRGDQLKQEYLGVALFPTVASCFNHSCDPNTFVVDIGRIQATVASQRIFAGEEVSQGYGGHFGDTERERRQKLLSDRYRFTCQCEACTEDWPLTTSLLEQSTTFSDAPATLLKDHVNCEALDAKNELLRDRVEADLGRGRVSSALALTCDRVRLSSDNLRRPHALHIMGRLALVQYFWALYANRGPSWRPIRLPLYF